MGTGGTMKFRRHLVIHRRRAGGVHAAVRARRGGGRAPPWLGRRADVDGVADKSYLTSGLGVDT